VQGKTAKAQHRVIEKKEVAVVTRTAPMLDSLVSLQLPIEPNPTY
jgi:hypothetical protein